MTSPVEQVTVCCPECHAEYQTYYRASMNLSMDPFSAKYVRRMSTGKCPVCYSVVQLGTLMVDEDGTFRAP